MPKKIVVKEFTETVTRSIIEIQCSFCEKNFPYGNDCERHEWENHLKPQTLLHEEIPWDNEEEIFRFFPNLETFKAYVKLFWGSLESWEGSGWYHIVSETESWEGKLTKVEDSKSAHWGGPLLEKVLSVEISFEEKEGFEERNLHLSHLNLTIHYWCPNDVSPEPEDVVISWKNWMSGKEIWP